MALDNFNLTTPAGVPAGGKQEMKSTAQVRFVVAGDDVKAIIESIVDSSISKPYTVYVNAGLYPESSSIINGAP